MNELKKSIIQEAHTLGLSDIRCTDADKKLPHSSGNPVSPADLLPGAHSLIVLFKAYCPTKPAPAGHMPLSPYYVASHSSYHAARSLNDYIQNLGYSSALMPSLPAKAAALRTGGFIGDNGFYYHPKLGSLICIQTLLTDAELSPDEPEAGNSCLHCGACAAGCPSGAFEKEGSCLRRHMNALVPEPIRCDIFQLLGCEKCQTVCPLNHSEAIEPCSFPLEALLSGSAMPELKNLAGPNMARPMRVKSQAALYSAATGQRQLIPQLTALAQSGIEPAATHAAWALSQLQNEVKL
jgi:epoxyqueuosine reductase QueG